MQLQQTPFPIMPMDMAIRICLASSPPLHSFLGNHDDRRYRPAAASPSCTPSRPCSSSGCCDPVSMETPASGETAAGKGASRKNVAFADSLGSALTTVYVFSEDEDDPSAESQFHLTELEDATETSSSEEVKDASESGSGSVSDFTPPAADYSDSRIRLKAQQVCSETCSVQDHLLSGTVQVRNICFEKSVSVRITFDSWSSFQDIRCQYSNNVYGCPDTDTFAFSVSVPKDSVSPNGVEFCIKYQTKDQVHWDNNLGRNYRSTMVDPTGCSNWTSGQNTGRDTQRDSSRQKMDKMEFDPFGSPRTSAGIFPEWQSWSRVETGAPYCGVQMMGDSRLLVEESSASVLQRIHMEEGSMSVEREFSDVVKNFEAVRKSWSRAESESKKYKESSVKSDVAKAASEIKLKHARNQSDVEMKKRHKIEADYQYSNRQMQLMCDISVQDSKSSACLNDEQKSSLATFEHRGANTTSHRSTKRLSVIDESSFSSHSDISYDRTDDDVDLDTTVIKPSRSRARERRRSSMGPVAGGPVGKWNRSGNSSTESQERQTVEKGVETIVKAALTTPDAGGQIRMVSGITQESPEDPGRSVTQECAISVGVEADQTSLWSTKTLVEPEASVEEKNDPVIKPQRTLKHVFSSKTVIRPETCVPCGKRIRFGKLAVKCRNCRSVAHPECKEKFPNGCSSSNAVTGSGPQMDSLEAFAPSTHPRVPQIIVDCVAEIERRGLHERGLYRVPGGERPVRDLRDRILQGKQSSMLSKVQDIHVVCGFSKYFSRRSKEPLITFRSHRTFMEASELDEDNGSAVSYRAISELPKANRDTSAFLMIHLHKVMRSPKCQMDQNNLARVFGPTIVGHSMPEPSPTTILRDTTIQPKVVCCSSSLPEAYWRRILTVETDQNQSTSSSGRLFQPSTSPELNNFYKITSSGSVRGRIRETGPKFSTTDRPEPGRKFFTSPS